MSLTADKLNVYASTAEAVTVGAGTDTHGSSWTPADPALTDGTGLLKAQKVSDQLIATSTNGATLDLTALPGGINNANINFSKVKRLIAENMDPTNAITLAPGTSNAWTGLSTGGALRLDAGEFAVLNFKNAGTTKVVDGTHKTLLVTAIVATPQLRLIVVGEGA